MSWNYRAVRRALHDGVVYAMCEVYYAKDDSVQAWSEEAYFVAQDMNDLVVMIDRLEADFKRDGTIAEWADTFTDSEYLETLRLMRHATEKPAIDEEKQMEALG